MSLLIVTGHKLVEKLKHVYYKMNISTSITQSLDIDSCVSGQFDDVVVKWYTGHSDDVSCCSFSSDWKMLVTGADDFTLRLWNLEDSKVVHTLKEHKQKIRCVSFSYDNEMIASGGYDKIILIWNICDGKCIKRLSFHTSCVECVSFSKSGLLLCSGSWDYSAALWDLSQGNLLTVLKNHDSVVQCCSFSNMDNMLATGSWDYSILIYDIFCQETTVPGDGCEMFAASIKSENFAMKPKILKYHESNIKCLAFSCDDLLASASWDCTVCIWNTSTGVCLHVLHGHEGFVQTCTFSTNGLILASAADDKTVRIWSVKDGSLIKTLDAYAEEIHQLSFTESGTLLSSGPESVSLCLY